MSLSGNGIKDWLMQRFTAVFLLFYLSYVSLFFIKNAKVSYATWVDFFTQPVMQVATLIALGCIALHAWIGIWTVLTDYVHKTGIRYLMQSLVLVTILAYFVWGIQILYQL